MALRSGGEREFLFPILTLIVVVGLGYIVVRQQMTPIAVGIIVAGLFLFSFASVPLSMQLLIVSMLLSPEFVVAQTEKRGVTIRLEDIILVVVTSSWILRMAVLKDVGFVFKTPLNPPIILYSVVAVLSTAFGVWRGSVELWSGFFFVLKFVEYFILFMMVVNYVRDFDTFYRMLNTMLVVCGVICLYGFYQALTGGDVAAPFEGSKGEHNTLGGYLVLLGGVAGGILLYTESSVERGLLGIMTVILIATLLFSLARGSWIAGLIVLFILFLRAPNKNVFIVAVLGGMIMLWFLTPDVTKQRFLYTFYQPLATEAQVSVLGVRLDTSTSARLLTFKAILSTITEHPFLGFGVTGFAFVDSQYFRTVSEMGILGLTTLLWMFKRIHGLIRRALKIDFPPRLHGMIVGFFAGFWGLMVHAVSASTFVIVRIAEPFWFLTGLLLIACNLHEQQNQAAVTVAKEAEVLK